MRDYSMIRILVIDDDPAVRQSLTAYLEDYGFLIDTVSSGEEGVEIMGQREYDVVVVDLRLPGMTGESFIEEMKERYQNTHFLIHTGSAHFQITESLAQKGIMPEFVFPKPMSDMSSLLDCIVKLIGCEQNKKGEVIRGNYSND